MLVVTDILEEGNQHSGEHSASMLRAENALPRNAVTLQQTVMWRSVRHSCSRIFHKITLLNR